MQQRCKKRGLKNGFGTSMFYVISVLGRLVFGVYKFEFLLYSIASLIFDFNHVYGLCEGKTVLPSVAAAMRSLELPRRSAGCALNCARRRSLYRPL